MSPTATKRFLTSTLLASGLFAASLQGALASEIEDLRSDIDELKAGQEEIRKELRDLSEFLRGLVRPRNQQQQQQFEPVEFDISLSPYLGETDAPVTVVEFSDYQCPFCLRHARSVMKQLREGPVVDGTIKYVMMEFPIDSIHPLARKASEAALCAGRQGAYWPMHDAIMADPQRLRVRDFERHAETLGLDSGDLVDCIENDVMAEQVSRDLEAGSRVGVRGTPSFLVGVTDPENPEKFLALEFIRGAQPMPVFQRAIEQALEESKKS